MTTVLVGAAQDTVIKKSKELLNALMAYQDVAEKVRIDSNDEAVSLFLFYRCLKDTHIAIDSIRTGIQQQLTSTMYDDNLVDESSGEVLAQIRRYTRRILDVEGLRLSHPQLCDEFTITKEQSAFYSITPKELL
jgi:hypothetical protein